MIRTFTIISGFEITGQMKHFTASGYATPQEMLQDLEFAKQNVIQFMSRPQDAQKKEFDVDAFLDALNREKRSSIEQDNSGNSSFTS